jgi:dephospho-CoA kinase
MVLRTVGLTGGIASGKSTVARAFAELGVPIVDADRIARDVVVPGSEGLAAIVAAFGPGVLDESGALDRKKLGEIVFADPDARKRLNAITHPRIAARSAAELAAIPESVPYAIYEAALLVENGIHRALPALVVVAVDHETQIARLMKRDGVDRSAAEQRIGAQLPLADKVSVADFVIDNGGTEEQTRAEVARVHRALLDRFGIEAR